MQCAGQPVLPVSLKDEMRAGSVKIYCPKCGQVYHTPPVRNRPGAASSGVDGAAFGTTFPHLFLMTFANLVPDPLPVENAYVPRVFGFRVHQVAARYPPSSTNRANEETAVAEKATTNNTPSSALESTAVGGGGGEDKHLKKKKDEGKRGVALGTVENPVKKRRRNNQN